MDGILLQSPASGPFLCDDDDINKATDFVMNDTFIMGDMNISYDLSFSLSDVRNSLSLTPPSPSLSLSLSLSLSPSLPLYD